MWHNPEVTGRCEAQRNTCQVPGNEIGDVRSERA